MLTFSFVFFVLLGDQKKISLFSFIPPHWYFPRVIFGFEYSRYGARRVFFVCRRLLLFVGEGGVGKKSKNGGAVGVGGYDEATVDLLEITTAL